MHIIPVIDVRGGIAVRAVGGDRANYAPLAMPLRLPRTPLDDGRESHHDGQPPVVRQPLAPPEASSRRRPEPTQAARLSTPAKLAATAGRASMATGVPGETDVGPGLLRDDGDGQEDRSQGGSPRTGPSVEAVALWYRSLYPFRTIYVADLDGIEGRGRDPRLAPSLAAALPEVAFWIDAGLRASAGVDEVAVIGSETLGEADLRRTPQAAVLSLDFRGDRFLGPPALLANPSLWPSRVVVMTLARVGADGGPDLDRIADIATRAPHAQIYAAGGIRDVADLRAAEAAGAHGALIASALHAQRIKADDLIEIIGP